MATATTTPTSTIQDDLLERLAQRAAGYDRENHFFDEDFADIKNTDYLKMAIPEEFGGKGFTAAEVARETQHLAERAPADALALNMHIYWMGVAADMRRMGDSSLDWMLREGAEGEIFAAGHGETGNDLPLFLSTARAEPVDGGYRFYGRKMFGSLTPVWTRLGVHGMDTTDPEAPKVVHAFMPRDTEGYEIKETWDTLGMRATRSDDTILNGAFVPDRYIARILPAGTPDLFILCIFARAEIGFGAVYLGIARRALQLAVETAHKRTSVALTRSMAYNPEVQHLVASMRMDVEITTALLDRVAADWSEGVDYGNDWPLKLVTAKHVAVEAAKRVVDGAMAISGGAGMFRPNELERLYRDVRCGGFHPANTLLAHEIVGKIALGIDLGEQPRWG
ncbi:MAG: acyl-CoA/acyl-ACP dehydrogenase [Dehalococcoidia bacterium]|nr:acyl-CoA/acyl-ACP dehydrogenase [Dehalococcoidia bacterium]